MLNFLLKYQLTNVFELLIEYEFIAVKNGFSIESIDIKSDQISKEFFIIKTKHIKKMLIRHYYYIEIVLIIHLGTLLLSLN